MSATVCLSTAETRSSWDKNKAWPESPWLFLSIDNGELDLALVASEGQVWVRAGAPKGRAGPKSL